jgi:hypothetical protein
MRSGFPGNPGHTGLAGEGKFHFGAQTRGATENGLEPLRLKRTISLRIPWAMYRQRWGVEDSFKFLKTCLGWEEVQVLDWQALRTLVALAWVAAGFLYGLGVSWDWAEVQLLAKLGGWEPHKERHPGKLTLQRGLSRLLDMLVTQAVLSQYETTHHGLPPQIVAFLHNCGPPDQL